MDRQVRGDAVGVGQVLGEGMGQVLPRVAVEFGGQGHDHFPAGDGVAALVVGFDPVPERGTICGLVARQAERGKRHAVALRVVVGFAGERVFDAHPRAIRSRRRG